MSKIKTALVLEGGGMRGAYTAGALSWLLDQNIEFDNAYGISTGAVHLCSFLMKSKQQLFDFSVDGIRDKRALWWRAFLRCGRIVDYDYLFDVIMKEEYHYDMSPLQDCDTDAYVGLYDMSKGKTIYVPLKELTFGQLKASTSLPIIGRPISENGVQILDGGITEMIPIKAAINDGCNRSLIITTKPYDYVRKPAKKAIVQLMKWTYPDCPQIAKDYAVRHLNYQDQIGVIRKLEEENKAVYAYPSRNSKVTRLGGKREDLVDLYELGYSDMEMRKEAVFNLLKG